MSKANRIKKTQTKKRRKTRDLTLARSNGLASHVCDSLMKVLSRPRFGMKVIEDVRYSGYGHNYEVQHAEDKYHMSVSVSYRKCRISVRPQPSEELFQFNYVFLETFAVDKIPNLNRMGATIANLIYNRPVWQLTKE